MIVYDYDFIYHLPIYHNSGYGKLKMNRFMSACILLRGTDGNAKPALDAASELVY